MATAPRSDPARERHARDLARSDPAAERHARDLARSDPAGGRRARDLARSDRDLDAVELRALVAAIAADPSRWAPLVRRDTRDRHFEELHCDEHVGVWVISWASGNDTGFHDHDVSCGAVAVVEGEVIEERLVVGGAPRVLCHQAGEVFDFDASHVHRMRHDAAAPAVSIHAYSPPLSRMGAYAVEPDGTLRRRSISYEEELRPVEIAAW